VADYGVLADSRAPISTMTSSSPGTEPRRAYGFPMPIGSGRSQGPDDLRRDVRGFRPEPRLGKARCHHFSWQKALGGEAAHGMLILSPVPSSVWRPIRRLAVAEALPLDPWRQIDRSHFRRRNHQHAVSHLRRGLHRRLELGTIAWRLDALIARANANSQALSDWVERTPWVDFLAADRRSGRTPASVSRLSIRPSRRSPCGPGRLRQIDRKFARKGKGRL